MPGLLILAGIAGLAGAALKGETNRRQMESEYETQKELLNRTILDLNTQKSNLKTNYTLQAKYLLENKNASNLQVDRLLGQVQESQTRALSSNSRNIAESANIAALKMADLEVQAQQSLGAANQSTALSGFRNNISGNNQLINQKQSNNSILSQSRASQILSNRQNLESAKNSYLSAEIQKDNYNYQKKENDRLYNQNYTLMNNTYNQKSSNLNTLLNRANEDKDYLENEGREALNWNIAMGYINPVVDTTTNLLTSAALMGGF